MKVNGEYQEISKGIEEVWGGSDTCKGELQRGLIIYLANHLGYGDFSSFFLYKSNCCNRFGCVMVLLATFTLIIFQ